MAFNPYGWGYGGIGYTAPARKPMVRQAPQARSAIKQPVYGGDGAAASVRGESAAKGGTYSGRASAAAHGIGMANYGRVGMALGAIAGAILGSPLSMMRAGKTLGLHHKSNMMEQAYNDVVDNAANYGISEQEVAGGMKEGDSSSMGSHGFQGQNSNLGSLGTGGTGGIDSAGDNGPGASGGCFITTATVEQFGWSDDCRVLTILRWFRDNIMPSIPNGDKDVEHYYRRAPAIADRMTEEDAKKAWGYIRKAVSSICAGKYLRAYKIYKEMFCEFDN